MITIIAAAGENNSLGKDNDLVWHLPNDFKRFKELTSGNYILMGRKTFESFPKPLPNRKHLIITRQKDYKVPENCFVFDSISKALDFIPFTGTIDKPTTDVWIIGGGEIYQQSMDIADKIELTRVHSSPDADTFFPEIGDEWFLTTKVSNTKDDKHEFDFTYLTYERL
jgi:dihydrofolate reductase